jgi:hypothetical protein
MSDKTFGLFLGAGFSKWAVNLPVATQLFDFSIQPSGPRESSKLDVIKSIKGAWDVEHPNGLSEQFIADALDFDEKSKSAVLWYIVRRLSDPFIWTEFHAQKQRRHIFMIDEHRRFGVPGLKKAQNFIQQFNSPLLGGIITTNYDLIAEYALGTKGFNYGIRNQILIGRGPYPVSQWRNPVTLKGDVSLAKIHGSISWDENGFYTDGRRGLTGRALIIAPTPEKDPPESLEAMWDLAKSILQRINRLVVFGFAFNPYDVAVLNLLKRAGPNIESVLIIDVEPKIERAKRLWPNVTVKSCQPPIEGDMEIRKWFVSNKVFREE